jgi:hypothetical protein
MVSEQVYVALMHYPCYNKTGAVVTTAITNLDLHDIARVSKTFNLGGYFVVNPQPAQRELAGKILTHWTAGYGSEYNPNRGEALSVVKVVPELEDAIRGIEAVAGVRPKIVATAARQGGGTVSFPEMRELIKEGPHLILFGTGWGLTDEFLSVCDYRLEPVAGLAGYNHLPVRSAVAIILDRLLGYR